MLANLEDGNNQKKRRLLPISALVQRIRGRGRKDKTNSGIILVWMAKQNIVVLESVDLKVEVQWEAQE